MAKVTVSFVTNDDEGKLIIENDKDRNKDYTGKTKTKFRYGDTAYFRVYSHEPDKVTAIATDGELIDSGLYTDSIEEEVVTFITEAETEPDKPVKSLTSYKWLGNELGEIKLIAPYSLSSEETPGSEKIGAAYISYQTSYKLFGLKLDMREHEEYPVMVYVRSGNV